MSETMEILLLLVLYLGFYFLYEFRTGRFIHFIFYGIVLLHTIILVDLIQTSPSIFTFSTFLNAQCWGFAVALIFFLRKKPLRPFVNWITPLLVILLGASYTMKGGELQSMYEIPFDPPLWKLFFVVHIIAVVLAYGILILSVFLDVIYLVLEYQLKNKSVVNWLFRKLPSVETLQRHNLILTQVGLFIFVVSLCFGMLLMFHTGPAISSYRALYSLLIGVLFGIKAYFLSRSRYRGQFSSVFGVIALLIFIVAFLWVVFHIEDFHTFTTVRSSVAGSTVTNQRHETVIDGSDPGITRTSHSVTEATGSVFQVDDSPSHPEDSRRTNGASPTITGEFTSVETSKRHSVQAQPVPGNQLGPIRNLSPSGFSDGGALLVIKPGNNRGIGRSCTSVSYGGYGVS